jgi:methylenetetrahydrofolate dehydrogenase (NADP+) / methenyltetrahydrofolate cyclohydrolase
VTTDAHVIDGRGYAEDLYEQVADAVERLAERDVQPGLATLIIGENYPAHAYERRVRRLATRLGCHYVREHLPADIEEAEAVAAVGKLAADPRVSGILILRPLPPHISEVALYRALDPLKDIEAVHPVNAGLLALRRPRFVPSTPAAVFYMLDNYFAGTGRDPADVYAGSTIVVIGRSANVGTPASLLGLERNATVISCDEHTHRAGLLYDYTARADILIVAAGVPGLVTGEHVKDGVIAIDVGINAIEDPIDGTVRLVGDLDFASVAAKAEAVSPVPGGVGPITDVWLLANTLWAATLSIAGPTNNSLDGLRNRLDEYGALPSRLRHQPRVWMAAV